MYVPQKVSDLLFNCQGLFNNCKMPTETQFMDIMPL